MECFGEVSFVEAGGGSLQDWAARMQKDNLVLYVDCCNSIDPYRLYRVSGSEESLNRVLVARPFTLYQLRELVLNKLEKMVQETGARVVMLSGVGFYGLDDPFDKEEWSVIWSQVYGRLKALAKDYGLLALVSDGGGSYGQDCEDGFDADSR
ncbi:MAG: hypothetical protein V1875_01555 [Candidatus Altiarchaeota archaeon]